MYIQYLLSSCDSQPITSSPLWSVSPLFALPSISTVWNPINQHTVTPQIKPILFPSLSLIDLKSSCVCKAAWNNSRHKKSWLHQNTQTVERTVISTGLNATIVSFTLWFHFTSPALYLFIHPLKTLDILLYFFNHSLTCVICSDSHFMEPLGNPETIIGAIWSHDYSFN